MRLSLTLRWRPGITVLSTSLPMKLKSLKQGSYATAAHNGKRSFLVSPRAGGATQNSADATLLNADALRFVRECNIGLPEKSFSHFSLKGRGNDVTVIHICYSRQHVLSQLHMQYFFPRGHPTQDLHLARYREKHGMEALWIFTRGDAAEKVFVRTTAQARAAAALRTALLRMGYDERGWGGGSGRRRPAKRYANLLKSEVDSGLLLPQQEAESRYNYLFGTVEVRVRIPKLVLSLKFKELVDMFKVCIEGIFEPVMGRPAMRSKFPTSNCGQIRKLTGKSADRNSERAPKPSDKMRKPGGNSKR